MTDNKEEIADKITSLPARSGNKTLYLIVVEDPFSKPKKRVFVSKYLDFKPMGVEIIGYEIDNKSHGVGSEREAIDLANKGSGELFSITFPWNRVVSIRNASYRPPQ